MPCQCHVILSICISVCDVIYGRGVMLYTIGHPVELYIDRVITKVG